MVTCICSGKQLVKLSPVTENIPSELVDLSQEISRQNAENVSWILLLVTENWVASWWVATKRHYQAKDLEKAGFITCST